MHNHLRIGSLLASLAMLTLTTVAGRAQMLDVHPEAQQTDTWCWAASGDMIIAYLLHGTKPPGVPTSQCEIVGDAISTKCCATTGTPMPICYFGGNVAYERYGYDYRYTTEGAMTLAEIQKSLDQNSPIEFSWFHDFGGCPSVNDGSHMMVLFGLSEIDGPFPVDWLYTYDPWTLKYPDDLHDYTGGAHRLLSGAIMMPYEFYVSAPPHQMHRRDRGMFTLSPPKFTAISRKPGPLAPKPFSATQPAPNFPPCSPRCCDEPATVYHKSDRVAAQYFAEKAWYSLQQAIANDSASAAVLGMTGAPTLSVTHGWDNYYEPGSNFYFAHDSTKLSERLGTPVSMTFMLSDSSGLPYGSISMYKSPVDTQWHVGQVGDARRSVAIITLLDSLRTAKPGGDWVVLQIPAFDLEFVVDEKETTAFTIYPLQSDPLLLLARGQPEQMKSVNYHVHLLH